MELPQHVQLPPVGYKFPFKRKEKNNQEGPGWERPAFLTHRLREEEDPQPDPQGLKVTF